MYAYDFIQYFNPEFESSFGVDRPSSQRLAAHVLTHTHSGDGRLLPLRRHLPGPPRHGQPQTLQAQQRPHRLQRRSSRLQSHYAMGGQ